MYMYPIIKCDQSLGSDGSCKTCLDKNIKCEGPVDTDVKIVNLKIRELKRDRTATRGNRSQLQAVHIGTRKAPILQPTQVRHGRNPSLRNSLTNHCTSCRT